MIGPILPGDVVAYMRDGTVTKVTVEALEDKAAICSWFEDGAMRRETVAIEKLIPTMKAPTGTPATLKESSMFDVHRLNEIGMDKAHGIQAAFSEALRALEGLCGTDGREMAIVRTKLEEACFFAKRAMAIKPENQERSATSDQPQNASSAG